MVAIEYKDPDKSQICIRTTSRFMMVFGRVDIDLG